MTADGQRERLRETLRELEQELRTAERVDPELRTRIERTIARLRVTLERSSERAETEEDDDHSVVDHLGDAMRRFEASHPKLSLAVGRVVDALANLGI